jgi:hypothetical protein
MGRLEEATRIGKVLAAVLSMGPAEADAVMPDR